MVATVATFAEDMGNGAIRPLFRVSAPRLPWIPGNLLFRLMLMGTMDDSFKSMRARIRITGDRRMLKEWEEMIELAFLTGLEAGTYECELRLDDFVVHQPTLLKAEVLIGRHLLMEARLEVDIPLGR